jgi:hypothetical protein
VFDGFDDIYVKAALLDNFDKKHYWRPSPGMNWFFFAFYRCLLSFFYPDNFILQLLKIIAKNIFEQHYGFPIVFITFNIFVFPLFGRQHPFEGKGLNADTYSLITTIFLTITP